MLSRNPRQVVLEGKSGRVEYRTRDFKYIEDFTYTILPNFIYSVAEASGDYLSFHAVETMTVLGSGAFGIGCSFEKSTGERVVIKFLHPHNLQGSREEIGENAKELELTWNISGMDINSGSFPNSIIKTETVFSLLGKEEGGGTVHEPEGTIPPLLQEYITAKPVAGYIQN